MRCSVLVQILRRFFNAAGVAVCLAGCFVSCLVSCQWTKSEKSSVLVVAVDRLGVSQGGCVSEKDDATRSGLAALCDDSVRFTHAFTTSTLSAPAMGSILTGRYPFRSGLRHNGGGELGTLSSSVETVAERALDLGFKTLFVAAAPPLLRRTGLHQGFELFDDALQPDSRRLNRPAREVVDIFTRWLNAQDQQTPFFAVLHMSDLLFPWQPMQDDSGRIRESTVRGQLDEIDESLARLWAYLRLKKRWEKTTIVLVGLQGDTIEPRAGEVPALDLHSETTHVALFIKEATSRNGSRGDIREASQPAYDWVPKAWSFDANVSLADLGVTLFDWIEGTGAIDLTVDEARSLRSALRGPGSDSDKWRQQDRLIVSESAWARWQVDEKLPIRAALRRGPMLYVHDTQPTIYNTLTDAFEVAPWPRRNDRTAELEAEFFDMATELGFRPFPGLSSAQQLEERWARNYFLQRLGARVPVATTSDEQRFEILAKNSPSAAG